MTYEKTPWSARAAVETVRVGSASLSASYYGMLGIAVPSVTMAGFSIPAAAIGLGLVAGAADYSKGHALATAAGGGKIGVIRRSIALLVFAVLFVASMVAGDAVLIKLRAMMAAGPANVITKHDDAWGDLKTVKDKLKTLADVPTTLQVKSEMENAKVRKAAFAATKQCNDFTGWLADYRKACKPILDLRVTMAAAIEKANLEERRDELQTKVDALGDKPTSADPQATTIAAATGYSEASVVWALVAVVGFALELVSCFGRFIIDRPAPQPESTGQSGKTRTVRHAALAKPDRPDRPEGGLNAPAKPKAPKPSAPDTRPDGRTDGQKGLMLAYVRDEVADGRSVPSNTVLMAMFGTPRSTVSDWLGEWEVAGLIPERLQVGRCKVIAPAAKSKRKQAA